MDVLWILPNFEQKPDALVQVGPNKIKLSEAVLKFGIPKEMARGMPTKLIEDFGTQTLFSQFFRSNEPLKNRVFASLLSPFKVDKDSRVTHIGMILILDLKDEFPFPFEKPLTYGLSEDFAEFALTIFDRVNGTMTSDDSWANEVREFFLNLNDELDNVSSPIRSGSSRDLQSAFYKVPVLKKKSLLNKGPGIIRPTLVVEPTQSGKGLSANFLICFLLIFFLLMALWILR